MTDALATVTDERFAELPESARTVATILALEGSISPSTIAERTRLSERTIHRRLRQLERIGLVRRWVDSADARRVHYDIANR